PRDARNEEKKDVKKVVRREEPRRCPRLPSGCGNWEHRPTSSPRPQVSRPKRSPAYNHPAIIQSPHHPVTRPSRHPVRHSPPPEGSGEVFSNTSKEQ
ncbi:MAG: hypothetical protein ACFN1B_09280, partial [Prevotella denticola]